MADAPIRRALIAVYDKTGIAEFARALVEEFGVEIISTGGTAKHLKEHGIAVTLVEQITGFPEMLDGRVKTLHPKIHAAILADRDNPEHMRQLAEHGIEPIDLVVVNLYPFEKTAADPNCNFEDAIEMIDIGGPCLLRAAAKNHRHVVVVPESEMMGLCLDELRMTRRVSAHLRLTLAARTFRETGDYESPIELFLMERSSDDVSRMVEELIDGDAGDIANEAFPDAIELRFGFGRSLRYGENPHQRARLYRPSESDLSCPYSGEDNSLSFNNLMDADAALSLCVELARAEEPRPSGRATVRQPAARDPSGVFNSPDRKSPLWLLTWTTYGTWLPGDDRGFVSRAPRDDGSQTRRNVPLTPYDAAQSDMGGEARRRMKGAPVRLASEQARIVDAAFRETAETHHVSLIAYSIMPDHVHLLCQGDEDGSRLLNLFKGVASRRLGQSFELANSPRWWTEGGSKRYIRSGEEPTGAIDYVCAQRNPLIVRCFDVARCVNADGGFGVARPEGRGSSVARRACAVFIKHTNACGVGVADEMIEAYRRAYLGDPNAAMGGALAVNFPVDAAFAEVVMETLQRFGKDAADHGCRPPPQAFFVEVWIAPSFDEDAVEVIRKKKKWGEKVRLLSVGDMARAEEEASNESAAEVLVYRSIAGGMLVQTADRVGLNEDQWKVVTKRAPTESEISDLRFAWLVAKHTKSNAISIVKGGMLIGNGAGQMSRVMSCRIATWLARENGHADMLASSVAASDAFFPFRDGPELLLDAGVTAIIQPGGSKRDAETIAACDERGAAMIFTGTRHFKH